jgi:hypothetical protein
VWHEIWTLQGLPEPTSEFYNYLLDDYEACALSYYGGLIVSIAKTNYPSFTVDTMMEMDEDKIFIINTLGDNGLFDAIPRVYFEDDGEIYSYRPDCSYWEESYSYNEQDHENNYKSYDMRFSLKTTEKGYEETVISMTVEKHVFGDVNLTVYSNIGDGSGPVEKSLVINKLTQ